MTAEGDGMPCCIEHRAYARMGLLGNPSDVYFGRTISFSLGNFCSFVRLEPSKDLATRLPNEGYYGGVRLLMAICNVFYRYFSEKNIALKEGNFTVL
ncbi:Glucuronokinase 1 [Platanthera zijinensis]|uniref:Glucuronokinase 1 n=1 Tax=Platanthera zijinensis TaxID=2320716 RepID=A0AAP0FYF9_9ASPA